MPPNGVMTSRGKQGRKSRITAGLSIFPGFFLAKPCQHLGTQPSGLLCSLGFWDSLRIPWIMKAGLSASKRIKCVSNSQNFNQNTKYSRAWLPHLWSGMVVWSPCGSDQTKLVFREREMKQIYSEKQKEDTCESKD